MVVPPITGVVNMFADLNDVQFEVLRAHVDGEARRRKKGDLVPPAGSYGFQAFDLTAPGGILERNPYPVAPTVAMSVLGGMAFVGEKAGCVGPALKGIMVDALRLSTENKAEFNSYLCPNLKAEIDAVKKEIQNSVPKVVRIRTKIL
tara:strand:- start:613 stop:1053 length:441 start_codon:yes stop_codon:yes gene_type:complete